MDLIGGSLRGAVYASVITEIKVMALSLITEKWAFKYLPGSNSSQTSRLASVRDLFLLELIISYLVRTHSKHILT